jgi:glycine oxidase
LPAADVIVVGDGLAGRTAALACARRGLAVTLIAGAHRGAASLASAGVLGPSIGRGPKSGRVGRFMFAARDRFPGFLAELHELTGIRVSTVTGALEVAFNETHLAELRARAATLPDATVLDADRVASLEALLAPVAGGLHHPRDGAVDAAALLDALGAALRASARVTVVHGQARSLGEIGSRLPNVALDDGARVAAPHIVLAVGAWTGEVQRLPRPLPVRPVKGEVALAGDPLELHRVIFGAGGYLVPRGVGLLVGATSEDAGFDAEPTTAGALALAGTARALLREGTAPPLPFAAHYAGLRPMTPDGYPILGRDPDAPALLYACGYSRNGVLVSPLAADCLAALLSGDETGFDLSPFAVSRFGG